jgi:Flp pilus assembly protein TadD
VKSIVSIVVAATSLLLLVWNHAMAGEGEPQICDVGADYSLGAEDYPDAIRRHLEVVRKHPHNALAHYHLGFALGMVGNRTGELNEYQRAKALGLRSWDLFLNLGLAQFEDSDLVAAQYSLQRAVLLGENHSESHFNLALVDERCGMLADAERETLIALRLDREQPSARNLLGVIYADEGNTASATIVWRELLRDTPDFEPARENLAILGNPDEVAIGGTAADTLPRAAAVNAITDERQSISSNR